MLPEGAKLIGDIIVDYMNLAQIDSIGGPAVGAIPDGFGGKRYELH